jgi:hypothetical protein
MSVTRLTGLEPFPGPSNPVCRKLGHLHRNGDKSLMQQAHLDWTHDARGSNPTAHAEGPSRAVPLPGNVVFASAEQQAQLCTELLGAGALLVVVPSPSVSHRGRLGEMIEELVEAELARQGAPSPYLAAWSAMPEDARARLSDQLFRARSVGTTGIAIALSTLSAIAEPSLTPDDSATLQWLAKTTEDAPLVLLIDDADPNRLAYAAPVPLGTLLGHRASQPKLELSLSPPAMETQRAGVVDAPLEAPTEATGTTEVALEVVTEAATESRAPVAAHVTPAPVAAAAEPRPKRRRTMADALREEREARHLEASAMVGDAWRGWTAALTNAKGAQSLATLEKLFAESYVPLSNALALGLSDPRAMRAYEEFRKSFERSYTDAFATFGATNRRPRLVMDAFDLAMKNARATHARSAHVLVVDSLRFDIGNLVRDALTRETHGIASLLHETLVWSALPTTSLRQLETLARGVDALRAPAEEEPADALRGRASDVVRRLRIGSREIYKLDVIPAMLEATHDAVAAMPSIASATAEAIARHISTLPPRTLLFVVGDHGFTIDRRGAVSSGGASPEEVLVPATSWLVGEPQ